MEKAWEHKFSVDLKKAYDSVPRDAMWVDLGKLGVPKLTVQLIRSFHASRHASSGQTGWCGAGGN